MATNGTQDPGRFISIGPLLQDLVRQKRQKNRVAIAEEIAAAFSLIFEDKISRVQCSSFLTLLNVTGEDRDPLVLSKCGEKMRDAAAKPDRKAIRDVVKRRGRKEGTYRGGFCDLVGTGGDGWSTFNVSTTASIVASSLLLLSKHGNRASSSTSGSADLLQAIRPFAPVIQAVTAEHLPSVYQNSNYAFLFAPIYHS
ncbi:MAG: hypothetical protein Q9174_006857, partial [Haloplaca sp. 1 TL-2023]